MGVDLAPALKWFVDQINDGLVEVISYQHYSEQPAEDGGLDREGLPYPKAYNLVVRYRIIKLEEPA